MMRKTKTRRLEELRRVVAAAPPERFHMRYWVDVFGDCGIAYCAAGWMALDPWFQRRGWRIEVQDDLVRHRLFSVEQDWEALEAFFDLTKEESWALFGYGDGRRLDAEPHLITPEMVIDNIDRLLRGDAPVDYAERIALKDAARTKPVELMVAQEDKP